MSHIRFSRAVVLAALAVALILPASAAARTHVGVGVGFYGGYPYGYGPWGYGPWGYPYYAYPYAYAPYGYGGYYGRPMGEVHIKSPDSDARIYINGAFAGRAHDLKTIYLAPGTYNIEQRIGSDVQKERLYVLANRSLKIEFDRPGTHSTAPSAGTPSYDGPPPPDANRRPAGPESTPAPQTAPAPEPQSPR
ncbi:MAG TPA: hypothetical protein VM578_00955 [Candidatus Saccharimonadales bacterium]|nr:hypothetical protein [Candidatus Saccharimonadales bacterium]